MNNKLQSEKSVFNLLVNNLSQALDNMPVAKKQTHKKPYVRLKKKVSIEEFIERSIQMHGYFYIYDKTEFTTTADIITITCPIHGDFVQRASNHMTGTGCKKCYVSSITKKKITRTENLLAKAISIHNDYYDYTNTVFDGLYNGIVKIGCPKHGEFEQKLSSHLSGCGCAECGKEKVRNKLSQNVDIFIKKAKAVYNDKYDYSKVQYKNSYTKVIITCPIHGDFEQTPTTHLTGSGCMLCRISKKISTKSTVTKPIISLTERKFLLFIEKANKVHNNKYSYENAKYSGSLNYINITCKDHGDFKQLPIKHIRGNGCPVCSNINSSQLKLNNFIEKATKIHNGKYTYENITSFVNVKTPVEITCHKHGIFMQTPVLHMSGAGCRKCSIIERYNATTEGFIEKATKIHGTTYLYDNVNYISSSIKVKITCKQHGDFEQTPNSHLCGHGCPKCGKLNIKGKDKEKM